MKVKNYSKKLSFRKKRNSGKKVLKTIIFIIFVGILGFVGYSAAGPVIDFFAGNFSFNSSSEVIPPEDASVPSSQDDTSSTSESSEIEINNSEYNVFILPVKALESKSALEKALKKLNDENYQAAAVILKENKTGMLTYRSKNAYANERRAVDDNSMKLSTIYETIKNQGLYPIAKIYTFTDHIDDNNRDNVYVYSNGARWFASQRDNEKIWLNPYTAAARKYIADISKEISNAGFDTIIFDGVEFPTNLISDVHNNEDKLSAEEALSAAVEEAEKASKAKIIRTINASELLQKTSRRYGGNVFDIETENILLNFDDPILKLKRAQLRDLLSDIEYMETFIAVPDNSSGRKAAETAEQEGFSLIAKY